MSEDKEASKSLSSLSNTNNIKEPNEQNAAEGDAGSLSKTDDKLSVIDEDIRLHVITSDMSIDVCFRVKPNTRLVSLKRAYASKMGFQYEKLRLVFDGHQITDDETPEKLGMINDDILEIYYEQLGGSILYL